MFDEIRNVYYMLADDESKDIFLNRVLWNITGENKYIDTIVSIYFERMKKIWKLPEHVSEIKKMRKLIGDRKVIIYGIGNCGFVTLALLQSEMQDIDLVAFCDRTADTVREFCGYKVVKAEEIIKNYEDTVVLITPVDVKVKREIIFELLEKGLNKNQIIEKVPFDDWVIREQYFDDVIALEKGEVFVDAGVYNCGTDIDFIKRCPDYKDIVAFEPDPVLYKNCLNRIKVCQMRDVKIHNIGLWNKKEKLSFQPGGAGGCLSDNGMIKVQLDTLDHVLTKGATFIKMDIEGAELEALEGAKNTIMKYKPKLAICVYHKPEDIVKIPCYLHKIVPEYSFYMRHHSKGPGETVLYAVIN